MDSLERVHRADPLELPRIHNFDPGGTIYSRFGALAVSDGMDGFALDALREALFSPEASGRLMILTYETLVAAPALEAGYRFLGLPASTTSAMTPTTSIGGWAHRACTGRPRGGVGARETPAADDVRGSAAMRFGARG